MLRRPLTVPVALGVLLVAGCAQPVPTPPPVPAEPHAFVCRLNDAPARPGSELRVTVRADDQHAGLLLRIGGQSGWRALAAVPGAAGQVYGDTAYAWRADGAAGVLTDIRNIQTYNCTADDAAGAVK